METEQKTTFSRSDDISTICISSEEKNKKNKIVLSKPIFILSKDKKIKIMFIVTIVKSKITKNCSKQIENT
jgi:hypothetical protein